MKWLKLFLENTEHNGIVIPDVRCCTKRTRRSIRISVIDWGMQSGENRPRRWARTWPHWKDLSQSRAFLLLHLGPSPEDTDGCNWPWACSSSREANEDSLFGWLKLKCVTVFTGLTALVRLDFLCLTRALATGSDFSLLISLNLGLCNGNLVCK